MGRSTISEGLGHSFVRGGGYLSVVGLVVMGDSNPFAFSMCSEQFFFFFYYNIYDISLLVFELFFYFLD